MTCGSPPVVRAIEIRAGLRWLAGRERMRERSARPRDQAVVVVKEGKMAEGEDSCAARREGCVSYSQVSFKSFLCWGTLPADV